MHLEQQRREPTKPSDVQVFLDEPARPYTAIAMVQASDQGWGLSLEALKTKMVEKAATLGGDAVIMGQQSNQGGGTYFMPIGNMWYGVNASVTKLAGKIVVIDRDPRPIAPPPDVRSQPTPAPRITTAPSGRLRVLTDPVGADVYIGDLRVGATTPEGLLLELPAGTVTVSVRKLGYSSVWPLRSARLPPVRCGAQQLNPVFDGPRGAERGCHDEQAVPANTSCDPPGLA
jgi:hypothetical protein